MKIEIQNTGGIEHLHLDKLPPRVFLRAPNFAGKTSMYQALQAALAGDNNPDSLSATEMRQAKGYVYDGAEQSEFKLTAGKDNSWSWFSYNGTCNRAFRTRLCHPGSVGLIDFRRNTKDRIEGFLTALMPPEEEILKELRVALGKIVSENNVNDICKRVSETGWDSASKYYDNLVREAQGAWKQLTGESSYPTATAKAQNWTPDCWDPDWEGRSVEWARGQVSEADERLAELDRVKAGCGSGEGVVEEMIASKATLLSQTQEELEVAMKNRKKLYDDHVAASTNRDIAQTKYDLSCGAGTKPQPPHPLAQNATLECPGCKLELVLSGEDRDELVRKTDAEDLFTVAKKNYQESLAVWAKKEENLRKALGKANEKFETLDAERWKLRGIKDKLEGAVTTLKDDLIDLENKLRQEQSAGNWTATQEDDRLHARAKTQDVRKMEDAIKQRAAAAQASKKVLNYKTIANLLGVKGIRAEASASCFKSFNGTVNKYSRLQKIEVRQDGAVIVDGAAMKRNSGTEQWMADLALRLALAETTRSPAVVMEHAEILSPKNRTVMEEVVQLAPKWMMVFIIGAETQIDSPKWSVREIC